MLRDDRVTPRNLISIKTKAGQVSVTGGTKEIADDNASGGETSKKRANYSRRGRHANKPKSQ